MTSTALHRVGLNWYDAVGAGLITALAVWTVVSAMVRTGSPLPLLVVMTTATTAYVVGRRIGHDRGDLARAAASVVLAIVIGIAISGPDVLSGGPVAPPLGYGNANGSLYVLGVGAAVIVGLCTKAEPVRATAGLFAVVLALFAAASWSRTAAILALGVLIVTLTAHRLPRWTVVAAPIVPAVTVAVTVALGLTHGRSVLPSLVEQLSERRPQLWNEAMEIAAVEPVLGAGPGMFAHTSPTAMADSDARWAHSAYLQVAAELGIVGVVLFGLLLLWAFGALYRSRHQGRLVIIGTAVLTVFTVHAAIDYVTHFPLIVLVTALITGLCSSRREESDREATAVTAENGDG